MVATSDSGLIFSDRISAVETASMMSGICLNISQLRILLRILRNKSGAIFFEHKYLMKAFSGDMILPKLGGYNNYMKLEVNLNLFYFWLVLLLLCIIKILK